MHPTSERNALSSGDKAGHRSPGISSIPSNNIKKGFFFRAVPFFVVLIILLSVLAGLYNSLPISELTLNRSVLVLEMGGEEVVLTASIKPDCVKEKPLIWESEDINIAAVSNEGVVIPIDIGLTTITVSTEDGIHKATCKIEVIYPTIDWSEGTYTGEIDKDMPNGCGVWITASEESYEGYWEDGLFNGEGKHILDDGQIFAGVFVGGLLQGQGTWGNAEGDTYIGEFVDGRKHGEGIYQWADGSEYKGEFQDDMKHGLGSLVSVDGKKTDGEWKDDELVIKPLKSDANTTPKQSPKDQDTWITFYNSNDGNCNTRGLDIEFYVNGVFFARVSPGQHRRVKITPADYHHVINAIAVNGNERIHFYGSGIHFVPKDGLNYRAGCDDGTYPR
jgi:hypothetical protein